MRTVIALAIMLISIANGRASEMETISFTPEERAVISAHGPWVFHQVPDPSNHLSGNAMAIEFGRTLFHFKGLSSDLSQSCATCHQSKMSFSDGLKRSQGQKTVDRNSIAILNLAWNRWYGWAGKSDTLWGQSIHPIVDTRELNLTAEILAKRLAENKALSATYVEVFKAPVLDHRPEQVLVNVGKALAAWQETIWTGPSPFDEFRRKLESKAFSEISDYPLAAQRGLKLFAGKAKCSFCHFGPNFSDGEFHNIGLRFFIDGGRVDNGRYGGIQTYLKSPYRRSGVFSDEPLEEAKKTPGEYVKLLHRNWGEFRTPSLRNVAQTAPYMHDGSLATLEDVVRHYSDLDMERLHTNGESLLQPLNLSEQEIQDLVAFLESLTGTIHHR